MLGQNETLGDLRARRDPTADGALKARLTDPEKTARDDAAQAAAVRGQSPAYLRHAGLTRRRDRVSRLRFCESAI